MHIHIQKYINRIVYINICIYMDIYINRYICRSICRSMCIYIYKQFNVCGYICARVHIFSVYIHIFICIYVCTYMYIYIYIHTHTHACVRTYIHGGQDNIPQQLSVVIHAANSRMLQSPHIISELSLRRPQGEDGASVEGMSSLLEAWGSKGLGFRVQGLGDFGRYP